MERINTPAVVRPVRVLCYFPQALVDDAAIVDDDGQRTGKRSAADGEGDQPEGEGQRDHAAARFGSMLDANSSKVVHL